jgi:copper transport protein
MLDALAAVAQFSLYVGLLCAIGGVLASASLQAQANAIRTLAAVTRYGAIVTILATLGGMLVLIFRLGGTFDEATLSAVLMSSVGAAGGMRIVAALLLLVPMGSDDTFTRGMQLSYASLLAASFVFIGHASAAGFAAGMMAAVHVAIAGWWTACLIAMERSCRADDATAVSEMVLRFSKIAVGAIAVLIIAGIVLIVTLVALPLTLTAYLTTLAAKLGIAMLVFALAAYNKFRLTPRVAQGDAEAVLSLRVAMDFELVLILAVIVATTLMTTYNAPAE